MLLLQDISYTLPDKSLLLDQVSLTVNAHEKTALIGHNGTGKSTLLRIMAGELPSSGGEVIVNAPPYYVPQHFGQYDHLTVSRTLQVESKLRALTEILNGRLTAENYAALDDDWTIEERCREALHYWQLEDIDLAQELGTLSGGQKTRVFLSGISIHQPGLILLDEPSNHLDIPGRQILYNFIESTQAALIVVSHDRKLLNLLNIVCELSNQGISVYGGNYDFYTEQKKIQSHALSQDIQDREKALRKAREKERETLERQQRLDARGKKKQENAGTARIMMNTLRNNAENSTSKLKGIHAEKISGISKELQELRANLPDIARIQFGFDNSGMHRGKVLFSATGINLSDGNRRLWAKDLDFQLVSGERVAIKGMNGSGKTTLIKIITGQTEPSVGKVYGTDCRMVYVDQDYSLIDSHLNIYEQALQFSASDLQEHEIKTRLHRFLFTKESWDKPCHVLSGGERMRLLLCGLTLSRQSPDIIILDEPTNNLDLQNIEILTTAIGEYQGTLLVVSHDETFLTQIDIQRVLQL